MGLSPDEIARYQRQILLAPIGGAGQERIREAVILLHGAAALAATYLAAGGLGTLLHTGAAPDLAARDPCFHLKKATLGAESSLVLDLGDGAAWAAAKGPRLWGAADGGRVLLGVEPRPVEPARGAARAILETLAAGEALRRILGQTPHEYQFEPSALFEGSP